MLALNHLHWATAVTLPLQAVTRVTLKLKPMLTFADDRKLAAINCFRVLGPEAKTAVPALIESFDHAGSRSFHQLHIAEVFAQIGPSAKAAIPSLLRVATDTNNIARNTAIIALGQIHGDPEKVMPMLTGLLNDPNRSIQINAAHGLEQYGPDAKMAVPVLVQLLGDEDRSVSDTVRRALTKIDPDGRAREISDEITSQLFPEAAEKAGVYKEFPQLKISSTNNVSTNAPVAR
jgi:HEAT repeat protein